MTAWDSSADADAFEQALREWAEAEGDTVLIGRPGPDEVAFAMTTTENQLVRTALSAAVSSD
jgi:hypothetical protein